MRILIRTSKWATWARTLGSLAVPLAVIPVLLHRERFITSDVFLIVALAAGLLALLALLVSLIALARLWHTGDQGWGRALAGLLLSLLCLAPVAWFASLALRLQPATDIATTSRAELPLVFDPDTASMPAPKLLAQAQLEAIYPNVKTRTYPLDVLQTYDIVLRMVQDRGWTVRLAHQPIDDLETGQINAQAMTLPGWREEAVLRIAATADGSSVDMRSASLNAEYDFGSNGARIEAFLTDLDTEITTLLRDNPTANQPLDPDADAEDTPEDEEP